MSFLVLLKVTAKTTVEMKAQTLPLTTQVLLFLYAIQQAVTNLAIMQTLSLRPSCFVFLPQDK